MVESIVQAHGVRKTLGKQQVLDDIDLEVRRGSVLALLGPNGAGKTTTVRILTTLLKPDSGSITVAGHDVLRSRHSPTINRSPTPSRRCAHSCSANQWANTRGSPSRGAAASQPCPSSSPGRCCGVNSANRHEHEGHPHQDSQEGNVQ